MLSGKKVLLTAGPTYEPIDPVRFIGNHSTGKMGFALAECFARQGAEVLLVSGPVQLKADHENITTISVTTADQMYEACKKHAFAADILVFAAAVADYKPAEVATSKIKKNEAELTIRLVKNVDIAATICQTKTEKQFAVGFALETDNEEENAKQKLIRKNLDMVVLNSLNDAGAGFKHDTNKISIIDRQKMVTFELKEKAAVAQDIVQAITERLYA